MCFSEPTTLKENKPSTREKDGRFISYQSYIHKSDIEIMTDVKSFRFILPNEYTY